MSIGAHEVYEDDDWQMTFGSGPALYGFAFDLIGNNDPGVVGEESFSVYGLDNSLLDTDSPPTWPGVHRFYGVVSDVPIGRVECDEDTGPDDIDLAEFRFAGITEVPSPTELCSTLGNDSRGHRPDRAIFTVQGIGGESITLQLRADPPESGLGKMATLVLNSSFAPLSTT